MSCNTATWRADVLQRGGARSRFAAADRSAFGRIARLPQLQSRRISRYARRGVLGAPERAPQPAKRFTHATYLSTKPCRNSRVLSLAIVPGTIFSRWLCRCSRSPKSAGQDGPLLYPGPLCGGEAGTTGRAAGVDREVDSFSHGQDARSKSPAPPHGLAGQDARRAPSGVSFSLGYFSFGQASIVRGNFALPPVSV
jgi:hypothetical protein